VHVAKRLLVDLSACLEPAPTSSKLAGVLTLPFEFKCPTFVNEAEESPRSDVLEA